MSGKLAFIASWSDDMRDLVGELPRGTRGFLVGRFIGFNDAGLPLVASASDDTSGVSARSLVALEARQVGSEVALAVLDKEENEFLILGVIRPPVPVPVAEADGERVVIEGRREVVLRCGKASITLKPDGSIILRGGQILSRADGANRVQGASVHLN